jgi:HD-GYP domain-containing protein (c-di-GMP phosphodiesterase class II)
MKPIRLRILNMPEYTIHINQLRIGVFIRLELRWYEHPFLFRSFKIKSQDQIETIKKLGISSVTCIPEKSDRLPASPPPGRPDHNYDSTSQPARPPHQGQSSDPLWNLKRERIERLKKQRQGFDHCEKHFEKTLERVKSVMRNLGTASKEVVDEANTMIEGMVSSLLSEKDIVVHLMNTKAGHEDVFYHSLNTAVLGMILGRECGLEAEHIQELGLGLIFHDIGKHSIDKKILYKQTPLTPPELKLIQLHPKYGEDIISKIPQFPLESKDIVRMHHETVDGKGYPDRLTGEEMPLSVKIASIANAYDNHCNKWDPKTSLSPHQALSLMFSKQKQQFDLELLSLFIRCLGIYPPGTIVLLSNDTIGIVVAVNSENSLRPSILYYDPYIPKEEALVFDMEDDPDISIVKSIHPAKLPKEIYNYLSPRTRVTYFIEPPEPRS